MVRVLLSSPLAASCSLCHLSTHIDRHPLLKLAYMGWSYLCYPFLLLRHRIDLVHIHGGMKSSFFRKSYFLLVGKLLGRRVIYHMHSAMVEEYLSRCGPWKLRLVRLLFDRYDLLIALSVSWQAVLRRHTRTPVVVVCNPVHVPFPPVKRQHRVDGKPFTVLTLGVLGPRKGTDDILRVAALVKEYPIIFRIGGNGNLALYRERAEQFGVSDTVTFLGWVRGERREAELRKADAYLLPSHHEGLPMSLLEAMGHGLPVISTPVGGVAEVIREGENGMLINPGDTAAISRKLRVLLGSAGLCAAMGRSAYRTARESFDSAVVANQLEHIYSGFLRRPQSTV